MKLINPPTATFSVHKLLKSIFSRDSWELFLPDLSQSFCIFQSFYKPLFNLETIKANFQVYACRWSQIILQYEIMPIYLPCAVLYAQF